jgi:transcriptional regulator with XRE-family HTH domain
MIGDNIRRVRTRKGYSQQLVADRIGISQSKLNRIESNQSNISAKELLELCGILEVDTMELMKSEKVSIHNNNHDNSTFNGYVENLINCQKELYEEQIGSLKDEIKSLRSQVAELMSLLNKKD